MSTSARVLTGIQPSGTKHLGNYFGAIKQCLSLQDEFAGECFVFIADYHSLTTLRDAQRLRAAVRELAITYLALGVDPEKTTLFRQSDVPEVTELTWLLATVTGMGLLERAVSYKDKIANGIKPSVGLFAYPILMAADILIYDGTVVPVGKDQLQHVEMAQDMANHFNRVYGGGQPLLQRPEYRLSPTPYVVGSDGRKMSTSYGNTIPIFASGKQLKKLIGGIVTDSTPLGQPLNPDDCHVFSMLKLFADADELTRIEGFYRSGRRDGAAFGYGHAKALLREHIETHFAAAHQRREALLAQPERVDQILRQAAQRARSHARETIERCKTACGLR